MEKRKASDLQVSEASEFLMEMSAFGVNVFEGIFRIADAYGVSRDETLKRFLTAASSVINAKSFENYELTDKNGKNDRGTRWSI